MFPPRPFVFMDVKELLDDLKVDYKEDGHHHCRPGWVQLKECPFCSSQNYHLGINVAGGFASCWKCGGHHILAVLERLGVEKKRVRSVFRDLDIAAVPEERKRLGLKEPKGRGPLGHCHELYLLRRGFDPRRLELLWKIEGIKLDPRLAWRIYIPIIFKGQRVSWTTRAIGEKVAQRYISASPDEEAMNHKHVVYGFDYCAHSAVIVEGPTDAWAVGPGAAALFGTAFTTAQVRLLSAVPYRFVCFDSSPEAQARALQLAYQLSAFPGHTCNVQLDAEDPGSAHPKELKRLRRAAKLC